MKAEDLLAGSDAAIDTEEILVIARRLEAAEAEVERAEAYFSASKRKRDSVSDELVDAMGDLQSFTFSDGTSVELQAWISCRDSPAAQAWMEANGRAGIIKDVVTIQFDKSEHAEALQLVETLLADGYESASSKMSIHNGTLKAELKQLLRDGVSIPRDVFQLNEGFKAKINAPK